MKHIDVAYLWIQDELTSKRLRVRRVKSEEPLSDATVVMGSETARGHRAHSDRCRARLESCLRITPQGAERLDRRHEVINEALAEEVQRAEQRKRREDDPAATVLLLEPATPAARDQRESLIPDP